MHFHCQIIWVGEWESLRFLWGLEGFETDSNWVQVVSDLRIKLRECEITPVGVVDNNKEMAQVLNSKVGTLLI